MTTYGVTAWCNVPYYATFELEASSLNEALEKAKIQARDEYGEPCGGGESDWDEFEIESEGYTGEYLRHLKLSRLAKNAALELLDACMTLAEDCRMALSGEWDKSDKGFQDSLDLLESVIAKAKGGAL
jgi:hypothetical protein